MEQFKLHRNSEMLLDIAFMIMRQYHSQVLSLGLIILHCEEDFSAYPTQKSMSCDLV